MPKKALPKLPVPDSQRCENQDQKGRRCPRRHEYKMVRKDGTVTRLCRTDAYKYRDQLQHHPEYFESVRFVAINKWTPAE